MPIFISDPGQTGRIVIAAMVLGSVAAPPARASQTQCRFDIQSSDQGSFAVDLPVRISTQGHAATVAVSGSGTYSARMRRLSGQGAEYSFITPVSREVIAVAKGGETLWQIDFSDGRTMAYIGRCAAER